MKQKEVVQMLNIAILELQQDRMIFHLRMKSKYLCLTAETISKSFESST